MCLWPCIRKVVHALPARDQPLGQQGGELWRRYCITDLVTPNSSETQSNEVPHVLLLLLLLLQ
eukprot:1076215-Pyramimonas_sp.AAC.1